MKVFPFRRRSGALDLSKCPDDRLLDAFFDGELRAEDEAVLTRHFELCPHCREKAEAERRFREILRDIPMVEPPAEFTDRLVAMSRSWVLNGSVEQICVEERTRSGRRGLLGHAVGSDAARRGLAWVLAVVVLVLQAKTGVFGVNMTSPGWASGLDVMHETISFLQDFSLAEMAKHVSEVVEAFRTGGGQAALTAVRVLLGTENALSAGAGLGFVLLVLLKRGRPGLLRTDRGPGVRT